MNDNQASDGKRFSHVYLERGEPVQDSKEARERLFTFFIHELNPMRTEFHKALGVELGVSVSNNYGSFAEFFRKGQLIKLLDSITIICQSLSGYPHYSARWIEFVRRVFDEENLCYRVDDKGGVHYKIDEEFQRNRTSTVRYLDFSRYGAVRAAYDAAYNDFDEISPKSKEAIWNLFVAIEILFKLMMGDKKIPRLTFKFVTEHLKPLVEKRYADNETALKVALKYLNSFCEWIDGAHNYRHGQKEEELNDPPLDIAVAMMASGTSSLRWLLELDQHFNGRQAED